MRSINIKALIYCLICCCLISCSNTKNECCSIDETNQNKSILNNEEWYDFIDSVYTKSSNKNFVIDSFSLYYMKMNTPEVLAKPKYVFWRNNRKKSFGEFDLFYSITNSHFLIITYRKRSAIIKEIVIRNGSFTESDKVILDLNGKSESLSDSCNQISNVVGNVLNGKLNIKIEILQSCVDEHIYRELNYDIDDK